MQVSLNFDGKSKLKREKTNREKRLKNFFYGMGEDTCPKS